MTGKFSTFYVPIYRVQVAFTLCRSTFTYITGIDTEGAAAMVACLTEERPEEELEASCVVMGVFFDRRPGYKGLVSIPNAAHEALHAACCIMEKVGIDVTYENQEVTAYILTYILEQFMSWSGINDHVKPRKELREQA